MRTGVFVVALAGAAFVEPPAVLRSACTSRHASATPAMILDTLSKAAEEAKFAAAELVVQQKVADKLAKAQEKYDIPSDYVDVMSGFFTSYMTEVYKAGNDMDYYEDLLTQLFKKILEKVKEPHQFEPYHRAMREPYDYYTLGKEFASGVIDTKNSKIEGVDMLEQMKAQVAAGDNVVLLANHQSEADPQIFSVLLDPEHPGFAEETIFVAGDRVTTDLLAQPFSMGRNLLCIYSKKHVDNPPELKSQKKRHNMMVMKQMQNLFKEGGHVVWVAPSGGRDRKGDSGNYEVAPFDSKSVEMFRLMGDKAKVPTHFYPLSMLTWGVAPPPDAVGGKIGEQRAVRHSPAGLHFGKQIDLDQFAEGCVVEGFPEGCDPTEQREALRDALSAHVHSQVSENYEKLASDLADVMPKQKK